MRNGIKPMRLALACGILLAGCGIEPLGPPAPKPGGDDRLVGVVDKDVLAKADLQYYWTLRVALDPGEALVKLWRLDENLYCLTSKNRIICVDEQVGVPKWHAEVGGPLDEVYRPCHIDDLRMTKKRLTIKQMEDHTLIPELKPFDAVIFSTGRGLKLFNRTTGELYRTMSFHFAAHSGGISDGQMFYCGSAGGQYRGLDIHAEVPLWAELTMDLISVPLERLGHTIFVASRDGQFIAFAAERRAETVWRRELPQPITAPFGVDPRGCFVPCEDGRIYAFAPLTGRELWDPVVTEGPLRDAIQVGKNTLFQYSTGDSFYAVKLANGQTRWTMKDGRVVLAVMGGKVYLLDRTGTMRIVDETLGKVEMAIPMTGFELFLPNTDPKLSAVTTATRDGRLFCIRPADAGYLKAEQLHPGGTRKPKPKVPVNVPGKKPAKP